MNYKHSIFAAIIATTIFGACSNDNENEPITNKYITISTQIEGLTRVADQADGSQIFTEGDEVSVYAWTGRATSAPDADSLVVNNSINKYTSNKWIAAPQMLWADQTTPHYFIGVYPKTTTAVSDLTAMPYTLNTADQTASDLLVATNLNGLKPQTAPVPLLFDHVMSRLVVNLTFRSQFEGHPNVTSVVTKGAMTNADVDLLTKNVTAKGSKSDITLPATTTAQYASIMIPQTGIRTIVITIDGKDYTFTHNEDIVLNGGKQTTVNLIVGKDEIVLGDISINQWQKGTEINGGEAQTK